MGESGTAVAPLAFVLDDEPQVATTICTMLRNYGFVTQQFGEPMPFFVELRACPPELAVLDLALEKTDAVEVMRHLSALKFRGKVLLVSGRDESILADMERVGQRLGLIMLPSQQKLFRGHDLKNRLGFELVAAKPRRVHRLSKVSQSICGMHCGITGLNFGISRRSISNRYLFAAPRRLCGRGTRNMAWSGPKAFFREPAIRSTHSCQNSSFGKWCQTGNVSPKNHFRSSWPSTCLRRL